MDFVACSCGLVQEAEMVARNKKCLACGKAMEAWGPAPPRKTKRQELLEKTRALMREDFEAELVHANATVDTKEIRMSDKTMHVFKAINDVKVKLANFGGIAKDRSSPDGGIRYNFRGIDDMYNALCGLTAECGLVMVPSVVGEPRVEFQLNRNGNTQTHVFLMLEVLYASQLDGSTTVGRYFGEAIDSSDKASNKAMSAAFKYAHLMAFQIPTEGGDDDDTEAHLTQVGQRAPAQQPTQHMPNMPPPQQPAQEEPVKRTRRTKEQMQADAAAQQANGGPAPIPAATAPATAGPPPAPAAPAGIPIPTEADWHIAYSSAVGKANSFKMVLDLATDANGKPEPGRSEVFKTVKSRTLELIALQKTMDDLKEARALIQALGSGTDLKDAYNNKYLELRNQPQDGMM